MFRCAAPGSLLAVGSQYRSAATRTPGQKVVDAVAKSAKNAKAPATTPGYKNYREFVREQFANPSLVKLPPVKRLQVVVEMWRKKESESALLAAAEVRRAQVVADNQAQKLKKATEYKDEAAVRKAKAAAMWRAADLEQQVAEKKRALQQQAAWHALASKMNAEANAKKKKAAELLRATQEAAALALAKKREAGDKVRKAQVAQAAKQAAIFKTRGAALDARIKAKKAVLKALAVKRQKVAAGHAKELKAAKQALGLSRKQTSAALKAKGAAQAQTRRDAAAINQQVKQLEAHVSKTLASVRGSIAKL